MSTPDQRGVTTQHVDTDGLSDAPAIIVEPVHGPPRDDRWGVLMARAQDGDDAAYRLLLSEIYPWLRRYFRRRFPSASADDAVQDVLSALHQKRRTYEPGRPFQHWLAAIARYKRIDHLRAYRRNSLDTLPESLAVRGHEAPVTSAIIVTTLLDQLKPSQAEAIRLVKIQGYSVKETSASTGQSESLVKVNVHRGLGRFARLLMTGSDSNIDTGGVASSGPNAASAGMGEADAAGRSDPGDIPGCGTAFTCCRAEM